MPDISTITLPSGNQYSIKDSEAREQIETLKQTVAGGVQYIGVTTTELTDGSTVSTVSVKGEDHAVTSGDMVDYNNVLFIFNKNNQWDELGSAGVIKALAYKDSASGNFTPEGNVTITPATISIAQVKTVGSLPEWSATVQDETLTFSWGAGSLPTSENVTAISGINAAEFKGTQGKIEVS